MKVYKVRVDNYDYDEYDSFVVVAESEEEVRNNFFRKELFGSTIHSFDCSDKFYCEEEMIKGFHNEIYFGKRTKSIDDIHIEEVDMTKKSVICASYNAG